MGIIEALIEIVVKIISEVLTKIAGQLTDRALSRMPQVASPTSRQVAQTYAATCGDEGLDLRRQRLYFSVTFGNYFASLLESSNTYLEMPGQIHCPAAGKSPLLEWIYGTLSDAQGFRIIAIEAGGGMGKTTLAAKIVRCLYQQNAVDLILGDSAKRVEIDPATGQPRQVQPGFTNLDSFYRRLAEQTGLIDYPPQTRWHTIISDLRARLAGQRALIVLDNLDTVQQSDQLLKSLQELISRDIRVLLTTREANISDRHAVVVNLNPIAPDNISLARSFITWHITRYQTQNPRLADLRDSLDDKKLIGQLLEKTGGVPLIIQVVVSKIAMEKWSYLNRLPDLLPKELLDFLYEERWGELSTRGEAGQLAQDLLWYLATIQYEGRKITSEALREQARMKGKEIFFSEAMRMLVENFLLIDREPQSQYGNFTIFPSLREFVVNTRKA
jgi:hypothetical protein